MQTKEGETMRKKTTWEHLAKAGLQLKLSNIYSIRIVCRLPVATWKVLPSAQENGLPLAEVKALSAEKMLLGVSLYHVTDKYLPYSITAARVRKLFVFFRNSIKNNSIMLLWWKDENIKLIEMNANTL